VRANEVIETRVGPLDTNISFSLFTFALDCQNQLGVRLVECCYTFLSTPELVRVLGPAAAKCIYLLLGNQQLVPFVPLPASALQLQLYRLVFTLQLGTPPQQVPPPDGCNSLACACASLDPIGHLLHGVVARRSCERHRMSDVGQGSRGRLVGLTALIPSLLQLR
jgi:hypothetical protein